MARQPLLLPLTLSTFLVVALFATPPVMQRHAGPELSFSNRAAAAAELPHGYGGGGVVPFGDATFEGSPMGKDLSSLVSSMAVTPDGKGYWLVAADGGVFAYGDAKYWGSTGNIRLYAPIVGIAATPDGKGYWLVAADGGVFAFGDAKIHGSTGGKHLNAPIVGMAATPDGNGYWLAAADGGIFAFGDAKFHGSMGNKHINAPIVAIAATDNGGGYWLAGSDGGVYAFATHRSTGPWDRTPPTTRSGGSRRSLMVAATGWSTGVARSTASGTTRSGPSPIRFPPYLSQTSSALRAATGTGCSRLRTSRTPSPPPRFLLRQSSAVRLWQRQQARWGEIPICQRDPSAIRTDPASSGALCSQPGPGRAPE